MTLFIYANEEHRQVIKGPVYDEGLESFQNLKIKFL